MARIDNTRTTAFGLWRYASEFLAAANLVKREHGEKKFSAVAHYLICHSIELSLKAFLRARMVATKQLSRPPLGHDLRMLLDEARKRRLDRVVSLTPDEIAIVDDLAKHHVVHRFRYIEIGRYELPIWTPTFVLASKLVIGIQEFCRRNTFGRQRIEKEEPIPPEATS